MKTVKQTKQFAVIGCTLAFTHLFALFVGSSMQANTQKVNSHAHLSDVSAAVELGEYFTKVATNETRFIPARATAGIIYRILEASEPGPNSKARLEVLHADLRKLYPGPAITPKRAAKLKTRYK